MTCYYPDLPTAVACPSAHHWTRNLQREAMRLRAEASRRIHPRPPEDEGEDDDYTLVEMPRFPDSDPVFF